jgi:hypothetical protein
MSVPSIVEALPPSVVKGKAHAVLTAITKMKDPLTVNQYGQITYKKTFEPFSNINQLLCMATSDSMRCKLFDVPGLHAFMSAISAAKVPAILLSPQFADAIASNQTIPVRPMQEWITADNRLLKKS